MQNILVETEQNIELEYPVASIGERIIAFIIDFLIMIAYGWIMFYLLANTVMSTVSNEAMYVFYVIVYLPLLMYHFLFEVLNGGQSPGKMIFKNKVVKIDGSRPNVGSYLLRWILRIIDVPLYGSVAVISYLFSENGQRLGDRAANTTVIKLKKIDSLQKKLQFKVDTSYEIKHPEFAKLKDEHIALINDVLTLPPGSKKYNLANKVRLKVETYLNIKSELGDLPFLHTAVKDYYQYYLQDEEKEAF